MRNLSSSGSDNIMTNPQDKSIRIFSRNEHNGDRPINEKVRDDSSTERNESDSDDDNNNNNIVVGASTTGARAKATTANGSEEEFRAEEEEKKEEVVMNNSDKNNDDNDYWYEPPVVVRPPKGAQHGRGGVFYGGNWVDIEDCVGTFIPENCKTCPSKKSCRPPRSMSRNAAEAVAKATESNGNITYDAVIVGAGCIGGAVARELSKYELKILWLEAADDVSQGATKGNSGIVHAGYDDKPGTNRAKYCWKGNQMFADLDKQLRFGYQKNGSLVVAFNQKDMDHLEELKQRGEINGVQHLRIVCQDELHKMEPNINPKAIGALYSSEAGNVIPYEYAIALAENAVDNGVELRIRREVQMIEEKAAAGGDDKIWELKVRHWEPSEYVNNQKRINSAGALPPLAVFGFALAILIWLFSFANGITSDDSPTMIESSNLKMVAATILGILLGSSAVIVATMTDIFLPILGTKINDDIKQLVEKAGKAIGIGGTPVGVSDMLIGGSGSSRIQQGVTVATETVRTRYIVNCAGGASDQIANMIGDTSFQIKPRIGDYILLNRNQGNLAKHTLFPCPDPKLGKGVLVQTTLWSNLILGPTARDMHDKTSSAMTRADIQEYILSKCKFLVPGFDPKQTIHTFCGARAKNTRGDWIIEPSPINNRMIHVAGIDSPGLAGSPAIALEVIRLLKSVGLRTPTNPSFNPNRAPIITPKSIGMKGLKIGPVGKNDSVDGTNEAQMAANVICKCERVTELEVVRALRRSLPIDSTQAIRKRTRAGMGHCQGDPNNYNCEGRVKAIIARETGTPIEHIGGRPWPATSILTQRWIGNTEKEELSNLKG